MILVTFFCNKNISLLSPELSQNTISYVTNKWKCAKNTIFIALYYLEKTEVTA